MCRPGGSAALLWTGGTLRQIGDEMRDGECRSEIAVELFHSTWLPSLMTAKSLSPLRVSATNMNQRN